jgi:hypothetical protein
MGVRFMCQSHSSYMLHLLIHVTKHLFGFFCIRSCNLTKHLLSMKYGSTQPVSPHPDIRCKCNSHLATKHTHVDISIHWYVEAHSISMRLILDLGRKCMNWFHKWKRPHTNRALSKILQLQQVRKLIYRAGSLIKTALTNEFCRGDWKLDTKNATSLLQSMA